MAGLPAPPTSFPHFTRLPTEIRLMIWRCCLPPRIVEVIWEQYHCIFGPLGIDKTWTDIALSLPVKPPLISRVCRESREEALFRAKYDIERPIKLSRCPGYAHPEPTWRERVNLWFDKSIDTIIFHSHSISAPSISLDRSGNGDREISTKLRDILSDSSIPLCIGRSLSQGGRHQMTRFVKWAFEYIATRKECTVVIGEMQLHTTYQKACESGLFGHFAEADVVHIDVNDYPQKRKLQVAQELAGSYPAEDLDLLHYLNTGVRRSIAKFETDMLFAWLHREKPWPRNAYSIDLGPLSEQADPAAPKLPKFKIVISVRLRLFGCVTRPRTRAIDMGTVPTAD
ncbi:hypothetical protein F4801DRAFT_577313 [Xylaria longipes]|nr:hypothetical protein F4801DRAFT_577313 [Xylaria longipes]RYC59499.1 hypothetical protein CHU98_g6717 [Xylaria longipes]